MYRQRARALADSMADRYPHTTDPYRLVSPDLQFHEEEPKCYNCLEEDVDLLRIGRLEHSGIVAFCENCSEQFRRDKKYEEMM